MLDDNKIIELYIQRDESAISETAEKYGAYCQKIAYNILADSFDSEECVNDTYMRTWNSVPPTIPRILSAFLAKITRNIAIDKYKLKNAAKRSAYTESLEELCECVGEGDISDKIEASAIGSAISRFLLNESEICRRVFVRRYFFEDSISEIARAHFMSEGYVKTMLHRMRKRLAEFLKKEDIYV
ncbi:MAG: RNA polymerase sigma factor [Ruminococcaceae bacterium]|nr:RNA polymerase sigma factor [Oscillospiraceae bacterium]